ncbi:hypothetical protein [Amycolatopsis jejuensis]|uniref:hypothetical protein n=1 Tax=Amycolatopsis jejuensis TaxID=330084 RepID=UPI000525DD6D|nr:hypothetical protein [Amycolatopsis jejuensis]
MSTPTARVRAILEHLEAHPELDGTLSSLQVANNAGVQLFVRDGSHLAALIAWSKTLTGTKVRYTYGSGYHLYLSGVMDGGARLDRVAAVLDADEGQLILREFGELRGEIQLDMLASLADEIAAKRAKDVSA